MSKDLTYYSRTPVGQQLLKHFENRAELRRTMPLIPFSLSGFFSSKTEDKKGLRSESACQG